MKYFSTRNKSLNLVLKIYFLRGLAPDGGYFSIRNKNITNELINLSKLSMKI